MGNGSTKSRPNSSDEKKDEDEFKPVHNWQGEVIGWQPRTDSDKLRRKQLKNPPPRISTGSEEDIRGSRRNSRAPSRNSVFSKRSRSRDDRSDSEDSRTGRGSRRGSRSNSRLSRYDSDDNDSVDDRSRRYNSNTLRRNNSGGSNMSRRDSSRRGSEYDRRGSKYQSRRYDESDSDDYDNGRKSKNSHYRSNSRGRYDDDSEDDDNYGRRGGSRRGSSKRGRSHSRDRREELKYEPVKRYPSPRPTLKPSQRSRISRDNAIAMLYSAFKGLGTNEKIIIDVLGSMNKDQRVEVARGFEARYRQNLIVVLRDELSGLFEDLCVALVTESLAFDVRTFHVLIQHDTRHMALVGLLAQASSKSLKAVKKKYKQEFEEDVTRKIDKESKGAFREIFKAIFSDAREEDEKVDFYQAQKDANDLHKAVGYKEKELFKKLLLQQISHRHCKQVREVCEAYRQMLRKELTEAVHDMMGKKDSVPFIAYIEACDDPASFFAGCIRHCFDGIGTDDACLIRLFVYRCEIDMGDIAEAYQEMFDTSLEKGIKSETSGDYRRLLLKMLGVEDKSSNNKNDNKRESSRDRNSDRDRERDRSRDRYSRDSRDRDRDSRDRSPSPEDHRRRRR